MNTYRSIRRTVALTAAAMLATLTMTACDGGGSPAIEPDWTPTGTGDAMQEYLKDHPEALDSLKSALDQGIEDANSEYDAWVTSQQTSDEVSS